MRCTLKGWWCRAVERAVSWLRAGGAGEREGAGGEQDRLGSSAPRRCLSCRRSSHGRSSAGRPVRRCAPAPVCTAACARVLAAGGPRDPLPVPAIAWPSRRMVWPSRRMGWPFPELPPCAAAAGGGCASPRGTRSGGGVAGCPGGGLSCLPLSRAPAGRVSAGGAGALEGGAVAQLVGTRRSLAVPAATGAGSGLAVRMERCMRCSPADGSRPRSRTSVARSRW